jgi:2-polyprenyl-3-methyl-5-hydroxy-6-metoxy-1,4-benzoquinol methylase
LNPGIQLLEPSGGRALFRGGSLVPVQYQERFSEMHSVEMFDAGSRRLKAAKVVAILQDHLGDLGGLTMLDLGCSNGMMTGFYAEHFKSVVGVDIDEPGIAYAIANNARPNVQFQLSDGMNTGLAPQSLDVVTCTHVYEHVPDAERMMAEIDRVLRPGGVCLFIAGNRLTLMEADNHLPLLSVMPRAVAHRYLRLMRRGSRYYEHTRTVWGLRALAKGFAIHDYTARVLREPDRFAATDMVRAGTFKQKVALTLLAGAYWLSPTYIWVLEKKA